MKATLSLIGVILIFGGCAVDEAEEKLVQTNIIAPLFEDLEVKSSNKDYLNSPYVTAGDRLYMVGHQDGSFPDLGWHVPGEMGGIWDHPVKLMDGFMLQLTDHVTEQIVCLNQAEEFLNYPFANKHIFNLGGDELIVERTQFVPDSLEGMVVEIKILNKSGNPKNLTLAFIGMVDLLPVWLADSLGIEDQEDELNWDTDLNAYVGNDSGNPWFVVFGSDHTAVNYAEGSGKCSIERTGLGPDATINYNLSIDHNAPYFIQFYIAGSYKSREDAVSTYQLLKSNPDSLFQVKKERYRHIKSLADLKIPDKKLQEMFTWIKYNTDWLIRDVEGLGRGLSAGIPDYPWWFGADNAYALQGLLATGRFEEVFSTIDLLVKLSEKENGNGRIIHEASTNGVVFNPGNLNETPHFIYLLWKVYEWTGNKEFLEAHYPLVQKGLDWLLNEQDKDGNLYPDGPGMMEIHGLHSEMIDVVVYTQQALEAASKMARVMKDWGNRNKYRRLAAQLKAKINSDWWVASAASYADFKGSTEQTLALIDSAMVRADSIDKPWAVKELDSIRAIIAEYPPEKVQGQVVHHNWVVNTPMEMGIADGLKAQKALQTARKYTNRFGMYVTGIDRQEDVDESTKWKSFSYVGAVMTLPTGVQAIAENNYGNTEQALEYLKMLSNSFSYALPGSMYEVSPDYGMMVQAWNIYAVAVPVVTQFFGVKPEAYQNQITFDPQMPESWKNAELENIRAGDNLFSFRKTTAGDTVQYNIAQQRDWQMELHLNYKARSRIRVNGRSIRPARIRGQWIIRLREKNNEVIVKPY